MVQLIARGAVSACLIIAATGSIRAQNSTASQPAFLPQGWTVSERNWFYTVSQGSQMVPYSWFMALERAGDDKPFAGELTCFGYLPNPKSPSNPDGLPVGFVKDVDRSNRSEWIGLTCSACHTSQVNFAERLYQIDGGPTNADMFQLIDGVAKALAATVVAKNDPKFVRFANKVLPQNHSAADIDELFDTVTAFSKDFSKYVKNGTTTVPWGRARLDAFGMIFNRVTSIDLKIDSNSKAPDAPVSYPFLWDTHWHDVVQWNGSAPNSLAFERLIRNVGEVLGVFAHAEISHTIVWPNYAISASVQRGNQLRIENQLSKLRAPAWPQQLYKIDPIKKAAGQKLYGTYCASCHAIVTPGQRQTVTMTPLSEVKTDPRMASNAAHRSTPDTGDLKGATIPPIPVVVPPIGATAPTIELVAKVTIAAAIAPLSATDILTVQQLSASQAKQDALKLSQSLAAETVGGGLLREAITQSKEVLDKQVSATNDLKYKARPLDGIWATAPYLHNGSVPNLWQLLLPAARRDATFWVGSRDFDTAHVGFKTDQVPGASLFETDKPGNSNAGHDGDAYGTTKMTDDERWQLLEYLKSL
jgi:hypothetical protein